MSSQVIAKAHTLTEHKLSEERLEIFASKIVNALVKKFGRGAVVGTVNSESGGDINDALKNILEVGSLKYMKEVGLIATDDNELLTKSFGTVYLMNIALGKVLSSNGLLHVLGEGFYKRSGVEIIADRVFKLGKIHNGFDRLPPEVRNDTFTVDEMFTFYLGEYLS
jgi:hypothetical protein